MRLTRIVTFLTLLALLPTLAWAQAYGRLFGTVVGPDGQPMADVDVSLEIQGTSTRLTEKTNKKGEFRLAVVDATRMLTLRLSKEGFTTRVEEIKIPIGTIQKGQWGLVPEGTGSDLALPSKVDGTHAAVLTFNEGVKAFNEGDKATATVKFEEARNIDPSIKEVYEVLATLYLEGERIDDAAVAAETLLGLDPENRVAIETQFAVAESRGDREASNAVADVLIEKYPGESVSLIAFNSGILASRAKDLPAAERYFAAAVGMNAGLTAARVGLARVYFDLGKADEALALADEIIAAEPENATAWGIRYEVAKARGDKAKADEAYAKVFAANPDQAATVMYEDGKKAWEDGDVERAVTVLTRLLELSPDHARAHYFLGLASVSKGNIPEAKRLLNRFLELAPDDSEAGTAREMVKAL